MKQRFQIENLRNLLLYKYYTLECSNSLDKNPQLMYYIEAAIEVRMVYIAK